jgi:hypothetical protein
MLIFWTVSCHFLSAHLLHSANCPHTHMQHSNSGQQLAVVIRYSKDPVWVQVRIYDTDSCTTVSTASCTTVSTDRVQKKSQQFIPINMLCLSFHCLLQNAVVSVTMGHIFWPLLSAFSQATVHMDMFDCICEISQVKIDKSSRA